VDLSWLSNCLGIRSESKSPLWGEGASPLPPSEHGHLLIGIWATIDGKWDDNPIYQEVRQQAWDDGCHGAARTHIRFVNRLLELVNHD
jgi:hypothetical protein